MQSHNKVWLWMWLCKSVGTVQPLAETISAEEKVSLSLSNLFKGCNDNNIDHTYIHCTNHRSIFIVIYISMSAAHHFM